MAELAAPHEVQNFTEEFGKAFPQYRQNITVFIGLRLPRVCFDVHQHIEHLLTPQQFDVIAALVRGATVTDATAQADIDRSTFYLWRKADPDFVAAYNWMKQEQSDNMRSQLKALFEPASAAPREMLTANEVSEATRLKASLSVVLQCTANLGPETIGPTNPERADLEQFFERYG